MIFRTLRPRSAWSCATNMYWDTNQAITPMMRFGAKLRSSCALLTDFRPLRSTPRPTITPLPTNAFRVNRSCSLTAAFLLIDSLYDGLASDKNTVNNNAPQTTPTQQDPTKHKG